MQIVLVEPEIPQNTGAIGRTCVALDLELILIKPLGFAIDDTSVARSGTRYWKYVNLSQYDNWGHFINQRRPKKEEILFFEETGKNSFYDAQYTRSAYLIFGSESKGLPQEIIEKMPDRVFSLPMKNSKVKSLNLSNAATAAIYQAMKFHW
tara:strand:- start:644 stop:1096 length:453 start_codon:yes stop_codon:yes gene_type:complete